MRSIVMLNKKRHWNDAGDEILPEKEAANKKSKQLNSDPNQEFSTVVRKVKDCLLQYVDQPQNLPKTLPKFEHTAARLCTVNITIDADQIFYQLLSDGFISVDDKTKNLTFNKREIITGTSDYAIAYEKAQHWILSCKNPPSRKDSLIKSLRQICTIKKPLPFPLVVSALKESEYITVTDEKIEYPFLNKFAK